MIRIARVRVWRKRAECVCVEKLPVGVTIRAIDAGSAEVVGDLILDGEREDLVVGRVQKAGG